MHAGRRGRRGVRGRIPGAAGRGQRRGGRVDGHGTGTADAPRARGAARRADGARGRRRRGGGFVPPAQGVVRRRRAHRRRVHARHRVGVGLPVLRGRRLPRDAAPRPLRVPRDRRGGAGLHPRLRRPRGRGRARDRPRARAPVPVLAAAQRLDAPAAPRELSGPLRAEARARLGDAVPGASRCASCHGSSPRTSTSR